MVSLVQRYFGHYLRRSFFFDRDGISWRTITVYGADLANAFNKRAEFFYVPKHYKVLKDTLCFFKHTYNPPALSTPLLKLSQHWSIFYVIRYGSQE